MKNQPILVWLGIICLLAAAFVGWQSANRKKWFRGGASNVTLIVGQQAMDEWTAKLNEHGGTYCNAVATMLTGNKLPEELKAIGVKDLDSLAIALGEGGSLRELCEQELTGSLDMLAWGLSLGGIALILIDVLKERGMLGGGKRAKTQPAEPQTPQQETEQA